MDTQKDKSIASALLEAGVMSADGGMSIGGYPSLQFYGVQQLFMELRASNIPFEADDFASVRAAIDEMAKRHDQQQLKMHEAGLASVRNQRHLLSRF